MLLTLIQALCVIPIVVGLGYQVATVVNGLRFRRLAKRLGPADVKNWPPVTVLKPVHGLEKNLRHNLRSTVLQDYPEFQVVFSVQRHDDPAIPLLHELQHEFGSGRVTVAIESRHAGPNGKINNLIGGLAHAKHDVLVISDSDVPLRPDYLKTIVGPLSDPDVGYVCTLYKAVKGDSWFEKMELLTINAELTPNMIFYRMFGASDFCLGASTAIRRSALEMIGGLEGLADYLVEDFEMGRRLRANGLKAVILPYFVDMVVDLKSAAQWWHHLVYWDQNNRAAAPYKFFGTIVIRPVPFALLLAIVSLGSMWTLAVLAVTGAVRLAAAALMMKAVLGDREGLRSVWLVPLRDVAALVSFVMAYTKRTTIWRDTRFTLTRDGRLIPQPVASCDV
jgi:ceramide glucosyltransferase